MRRSFSGLPRLHIRPGMDVYSADGDRYLGSVIRVWRHAEPGPTGVGSAEKESAVQGVSLVHEEGQSASHARAQGSRILGEELGPFPTIEVGNTGPVRQSARCEYATEPRHAKPDVVHFAVRPGRINLGPLTRPFIIPTSAVRSLSMDRIVVEVEGNRLPAAWRRLKGP